MESELDRLRRLEREEPTRVNKLRLADALYGSDDFEDMQVCCALLYEAFLLAGGRLELREWRRCQELRRRISRHHGMRTDQLPGMTQPRDAEGFHYPRGADKEGWDSIDPVPATVRRVHPHTAVTVPSMPEGEA